VEQGSNLTTAAVTLENQSGGPAFFIRLTLVDSQGDEVLPVFWSDNYITLFPNETVRLEVSWEDQMTAASIEIAGVNVARQPILLEGGASASSTVRIL
jgi:exo-1,4-beta-D-glucosaminidase